MGGGITQVIGLRVRLEEKIRALEKEKAMLLEEIAQLKEVVVLDGRAKDLESEVNKLRLEVKALRSRISPELVQELIEVASAMLEEDGDDEEECQNCQEEE